MCCNDTYVCWIFNQLLALCNYPNCIIHHAIVSLWHVVCYITFWSCTSLTYINYISYFSGNQRSDVITSPLPDLLDILVLEEKIIFQLTEVFIKEFLMSFKTEKECFFSQLKYFNIERVREYLTSFDFNVKLVEYFKGFLKSHSFVDFKKF